jgi:prepilin-type N-terminal cleavage/methylation domain-containing protein
MKENFAKNSNTVAAQQGFSLLEMMVAVTIFLIVTGSVFGLLQIGRIDRNRSSRRSDMLKNARTAIHLMGRDVLNAGMSFHKTGAIVPDNFLSTRLGIPVDADTQRDILTSVISGNNLFTNALNPDTTVRTDMISFSYREMFLSPEFRLRAARRRSPGWLRKPDRRLLPASMIYIWSNRVARRLR